MADTDNATEFTQPQFDAANSILRKLGYPGELNDSTASALLQGIDGNRVVGASVPQKIVELNRSLTGKESPEVLFGKLMTAGGGNMDGNNNLLINANRFLNDARKNLISTGNPADGLAHNHLAFYNILDQYDSTYLSRPDNAAGYINDAQNQTRLDVGAMQGNFLKGRTAAQAGLTNDIKNFVNMGGPGMSLAERARRTNIAEHVEASQLHAAMQRALTYDKNGQQSNAQADGAGGVIADKVDFNNSLLKTSLLDSKIHLGVDKSNALQDIVQTGLNAGTGHGPAATLDIGTAIQAVRNPNIAIPAPNAPADTHVAANIASSHGHGNAPQAHTQAPARNLPPPPQVVSPQMANNTPIETITVIGHRPHPGAPRRMMAHQTMSVQAAANSPAPGMEADQTALLNDRSLLASRGGDKLDTSLPSDQKTLDSQLADANKKLNPGQSGTTLADSGAALRKPGGMGMRTSFF